MQAMSEVLFRTLFGWRAVLDVLVIAALFFLCLRTLRRLGTWKIGVGLLVIMGLFVTARILDLQGIEWIYLNLSNVALIALIVVFHPEIRKLFEHAAALHGTEPRHDARGLAALLADSLMDLAARRWGALIVLPGSEPIGAWVSGGFVLDAQPSHPLIISLFDPHSPGHDGGLTVEGGRLARFGVRLPLSQRETVPSSLGTRHHAAMGLAEVTDSCVLAVSEERGCVSLFSNGTMEVLGDSRQIADRITAHWQRVSVPMPVRVAEGGRRALLVQVAICLILAGLFWGSVIVSRTEVRERVLSVPMDYITAADMNLVGDKPMEVKAHVIGPKSELDALVPSQLAVRIDLSKAEPGEHDRVITPTDLRLPRNVRLLDVDPSSLKLTLRRVVLTELDVVPQLVGTPPPGLAVGTVTVNPPRLRAFTAADASDGGDLRLMTTPIYLDGIRQRTVLYCKIAAPPSVQPLDRRWPDVEVIIRVIPADTAPPSAPGTPPRP